MLKLNPPSKESFYPSQMIHYVSKKIVLRFAYESQPTPSAGLVLVEKMLHICAYTLSNERCP